MPDRNPHRPKYRHYKPKNLGVVRIDGRDHYLGRFNSPESWERYFRLLAEWSRSGTVPAPNPAPPVEPTAPPPLSINELILIFWTHGERYYRRPDGTPTGELENYRHAFRALRALYGTTPAAEFGAKRLVLVRQSMIDAGLSRKVINRRVKRIVALFAHAVENELIPGEVHYKLMAVKSLKEGRSEARETEPVRPAPDELVDAVKPFVSRQVWAMIELQRLTAMRSGEVTIMRTCDIDTSGPVWEYVPGRHKSAHHGKTRKVFLGPKAQEIVRPWLRCNLTEPLFQPREAEAERRAEQRRRRKTPLTPSQRARRPKAGRKRAPRESYDTRAYAHAVKRAVKRAFPHPKLAGIKWQDLTPEQRTELREWQRSHSWHPHQLRHNAATRLEREFGIEVARIVLGHSSPVVSAIYCEIDTAKARAVMGQVG